MFLHQLSSPKGSRRRKFILGRGPASGLGKTSGRGDNGQRSRSGRGIILGSEGGQMPLIRRIPKVGFNTHNPIVYQLVNVGDLSRFSANTVVDAELLKKHKLVSSIRKPIKVLGEGDIAVSLIVFVNKASSVALEKIQKAGGKVEIIVKPSASECDSKLNNVK